MLSVLNSDTKHIHTDKTKKLEVMVQSVQSLSCVQLFVTHGLQNARPPCPSLIAAACSNSCPLSQWCHPTISSSVIPFSSCLQSFFFSFFIYFFLLYNIVLVLPYINMHPPWVYTCSPSWTSLPPPSPYHPSGSSQCTSPKLPVSCVSEVRVKKKKTKTLLYISKNLGD